MSVVNRCEEREVSTRPHVLLAAALSPVRGYLIVIFNHLLARCVNESETDSECNAHECRVDGGHAPANLFVGHHAGAVGVVDGDWNHEPEEDECWGQNEKQVPSSVGFVGWWGR